jgi:signal transduction histidine kinase
MARRCDFDAVSIRRPHTAGKRSRILGGLYRAVVARRESPHHLVPYTLLQRSVALKQFVASQALFAIVAAAQSRPLDRHLYGLDGEAAVVPDGQLRDEKSSLRQVLVNLLGNAAKFTSKGEILLDVRLREYSGKRAVVEFSVKDTGIGRR